MTNLKDAPSDIAECLVRDNGFDDAMKLASDGVIKAQEESDNYALSVWREVKAILRKKPTGPE